MPLSAIFAGILLFLAAMPLRAAVTDPFPDQPGALSAEEIRAATRAMNLAGSGQALPLVASGKRNPGHPMPAYALFAGPFEDYSDRVRARKQIVCNFLAAAWRCSQPADEFRMSANGIEHAFSYQVLEGRRGNRQAAVDVVDFMYSQCFNAQFADIGGQSFTPSPDSDYISSVFDDGKEFRVATGPFGDGDIYRLESTGKGPGDCGFRIQHARMAKSGVILPESYAKEEAKARQLAEAQHRRAEAAREAKRRAAASAPMGKPPSDLDRFVGSVTDLAAGLVVLLGLAALLGPFVELRARGVKSAARTAALLTSATVIVMAVVLAALFILREQEAGSPLAYVMVGLASLLTPQGISMAIAYPQLLAIPATLLAVVSCLIWLVVWAAGPKDGRT